VSYYSSFARVEALVADVLSCFRGAFAVSRTWPPSLETCLDYIEMLFMASKVCFLI
jgi:hypothetical protein